MRKHMKRIIFLFLAFFLFYSGSALAQNEKFKALFMYNFTKYLEWPEDYRHGDFIVTVVGDSPIVDELKVIAQKKKVGFQPIVVKKASSANQIGKSHIVFIPESKSGMLNDVKAQVASNSTVIITDKDGSIEKGAAINYVVTGGRQMFEISRSNLEASNVKVGADLLSLGISK